MRGDINPPPTEADVRGYLAEVERLFAELFPENTQSDSGAPMGVP